MENETQTSQELNSAKAQTIIYIYDSITKDYVYKNHDVEPFFAQIHEIVPAQADFFEPWLRGFVSVAQNNGLKAKEYYTQALSHADKAAEYLPTFLQQGFAFFMYIGEKENALKFWNFGVEKKVFASANERFIANFNSKEQFWLQFAPNMCLDQNKARDRAYNDYKRTAANPIQKAIDDADFEQFRQLADGINFDSERINGVSILYYAIQRKASVKAGPKKFTEDLIQVQSSQFISKLDFSQLSKESQNEKYMQIFHQMRRTYEKSGLGKIMFNAYYGKDLELSKNCEELEKIVEHSIQKTSSPDDFVKQIEGKTGSNALLFAAETDDSKTLKSLIEKGSDVDKIIGSAKFGLNYRNGSTISTEIPNSLVYRLISFKSYNSLKMYLSEFGEKARRSMTEKSDKFNITPLTYLILNTIYSSASEEEFKKNKAIVDDFLPLFQEAGSVLDENTAFGTAKKLLGMKD